jgi:heterodisulfide reductase subunit A
LRDRLRFWKPTEIDADIVTLAAAVIPSAGSQEIAKTFTLPLGADGFFQEAHAKLKPVEFPAEGVYLCGMAHYPKHMPEAISQAYGAAGRVLTLLSHDTVVASARCEVAEKCFVQGVFQHYSAIEFRRPNRQKAIIMVPAKDALLHQ